MPVVLGWCHSKSVSSPAQTANMAVYVHCIQPTGYLDLFRGIHLIQLELTEEMNMLLAYTFLANSIPVVYWKITDFRAIRPLPRT